MNNPYYFIHKVLSAEFKNNLESHHKNHILSKLTITPKYLEISKIYVNNIVKKCLIYKRE